MTSLKLLERAASARVCIFDQVKVKTGFNEQPNLVDDIPYILSEKDAKNSARNMLLHIGKCGRGVS